jgi:hypothetical protein
MALAVETNVNEGMITSSPGRRSASIAASSSAEVHDPVSSARAAPVRLSNHRAHRSVNAPLPDR